MNTAIVIPARFASTRFSGKPLAGIKGVTGISKSLLHRTWEAAAKVPNIAKLVIATDDQRIVDHAKSFGASVLLTSKNARNGTERCAELARKLGPDIELIINFQGDAPLTPPDFVSEIIGAMAHSNADMATPVLRCDPQTLQRFRKDRSAGRVGGTTAVFNKTGHALYFSKEIIPHADHLKSQPLPVFHHVGLYAYRPDILEKYLQWPMGMLEQTEGLEQLRFLENGAVIQCVEVNAGGGIFWEVNNPVDIARVELALADMGIE